MTTVEIVSFWVLLFDSVFLTVVIVRARKRIKFLLTVVEYQERELVELRRATPDIQRMKRFEVMSQYN